MEKSERSPNTLEDQAITMTCTSTALREKFAAAHKEAAENCKFLHSRTFLTE